MTTVIIEDSSPQAKRFVEFVQTLPFAKVKAEEVKRESVWDAAIADGAISVKDFTDELRNRIEQWTENNA